MMIMVDYILFVHLLFKELHTMFGKLLILYSLSILLSMCGSSVVLSIMHHQIMINSQIICDPPCENPPCSHLVVIRETGV